MRLSVPEIVSLSENLLISRGVDASAARLVAESIGLAEADGLRSHGLLRLPTYLDHVDCGKVDGRAVPALRKSAEAGVVVDAAFGFAHPAIELGLPLAIDKARRFGVAYLGITNSYNCGVLGHFAERIAGEDLIGIVTANSPACVAPWGGSKAVFGTNPIALGVPRTGDVPVVIDQSSTKVARGEVLLAARAGRPIPEGWALDAAGNPTTDPQAALQGTLLPAGDHKGTGIALLVEILAAVLTGANLSANASSFGDNKGGPPGTGQFFILLDPAQATESFEACLTDLVQSIVSQDGTRLPGVRRYERRAQSERDGGVEVDPALVESLRARG